MADFEDDGDFNSEQVQKIAQEAVGQILVNQNTTFNRDKAGIWSQQIIELILKSLAQLDKAFKYVVTCILQ
jgi:dynein light chain Tctex-type 1